MSAVDTTAVARVVGIEAIAKNLNGGLFALPQRIAVIGQGSTASTYATTKRQVTSEFEAGSLYGFGSPVHLACRQLLPASGRGVGTIPVTIYPLEDDGAGVAAAGDITPSGTLTEQGTFQIKINNILSEPFVIATGAMTVATVTAAITAAINAVLEMPVVATDSTTKVDLAAKWKGASGNDIVVEIVGSTTIGATFALTQPTGGATNPGISTATDQFGSVWETLILNCMEIADTTTLDALKTFGDTRWGALVKKPCIAFTGCNETTVSAAIAVSDARKTDKINSQLVSPASNDLPLVIAAAQLAKIAVLANNNPPHDYGSQPVSTLTPGADGSQWTYTDRDTAVKGGSSTIEVRDDVVTISDVVTFYHPSGNPAPEYRYVVDIIKLMNVYFNIDLVYNTTEWDGAPLIPDSQPTTNRTAKKPKDATAATARVLENLGLGAYISDPETAKASIVSTINSSNPKRLDQSFQIQLSGNANIISIDMAFGFYFGTLETV